MRPYFLFNLLSSYEWPCKQIKEDNIIRNIVKYNVWSNCSTIIVSSDYLVQKKRFSYVWNQLREDNNVR